MLLCYFTEGNEGIFGVKTFEKRNPVVKNKVPVARRILFGRRYLQRLLCHIPESGEN